MPLDKSAARVRKMFGEIAGRYDLLNRLLSLGIDRRWRRRTVLLAPPREGAGPILDVCTGTADLALAYWKASGKKNEVVGADFCRPMLLKGLHKIKNAEANDYVTLVEADALQLPFPDDRFQIVCVAFGLRNLCNPAAGLREMVRVCRPGGQVAVLEFSLPKGRGLGAVYRWYFHRILPRIGQTLAKNTQAAYNYLPASVGEFPQGKDLVAQLRTAGLQEVRFYPMTGGVATLYVGRKLNPEP
ncbi:MAG: bifunctional demethylmenaquinone methyltransferase/2-methoxy-6-polyprenyl-1,4-benzoquinol methylase UbiE [Pirellulales bacterium]|nr:bifunctional demethylmenaquinone methyltransferase/2-methoxy-6-polyprenyl-1,4-benzoquinol methylase UbiE [Pirellulales bacterium]